MAHKLFSRVQAPGPDRSVKALESERYVRWKNTSPRMVDQVGGKSVRMWMSGTVKSVPESWSPELESLGFERLGYSQ